VGHLAIQLAKWKGAQVITTTSTRNVAFVRELGADVVIDYTRASVADVVKEVDVVLDMMGEDVLRQAFEGVKHGGRVVSLLRSHRELGEQLAEIARLFDAGQLKVHIEAVFPLQDVAQAHKLSEGRHVRSSVSPIPRRYATYGTTLMSHLHWTIPMLEKIW